MLTDLVCGDVKSLCNTTVELFDVGEIFYVFCGTSMSKLAVEYKLLSRWDRAPPSGGETGVIRVRGRGKRGRGTCFLFWTPATSSRPGSWKPFCGPIAPGFLLPIEDRHSKYAQVYCDKIKWDQLARRFLASIDYLLFAAEKSFA